MRFKTTALLPATVALSLCSGTATAQSILHEVFGGQADRTGWSVGDAGDVNADGQGDFVVGSPGYLSRGRVIIYSGVDGAPLYTLVGAAVGEKFGTSVDGAGDVNGDGYDDVIAGAPGNRVVVISGFDGSVLHAYSGVPDIGRAVCGLGDLDLDGYDDFGIGAPGTNTKGIASAYSGIDGSLLFSWEGDSVGDAFGYDLAPAGDVNGDGHPDIVVGMLPSSLPLHYVRVFSGADGSLLHEVIGPQAFGKAVSSAGDIDGDGRADFMVGNPGASPHGTSSGSVTVYSGASALPILVIDGTSTIDSLGVSLDSIDDINGDGVGDLLIGAERAEWFNTSHAGALYLVSGADGSILHHTFGSAGSSWFGFSCASLSDMSGDGFPDYIAGGIGHTPGVTNGGTAKVISSKCAGATPTFFCGSWPNSASPGCMIGFQGTTSVAAQDLTLTASGAPPGNFGLFFWGPFPSDLPFGDGRLCIAPVTIRVHSPVQINAQGVAQVMVDPTTLSTGLIVGDRPNFQFWFRDPQGPGGSGFNTSNAMRLAMCK